MLKNIPTSRLNVIFLVTIAIFLFEFLFFGAGFLLSFIFFGFLIYFGWIKYRISHRKIIFWIGIIGLIINVLDTFAVRFLFIAMIILFFIQMRETRNSPSVIAPENNVGSSSYEELVEEVPMFEQRLFGRQQTNESPYQWRDINVHGFFGDRKIDLSNTVISEEAIISIRHLFGNIQILVPYEVEVSVHHSTLFGNLSIFKEHFMQMVNKTAIFKTKNYYQEKPKVRIITSIFSGDLEVRRI